MAINFNNKYVQASILTVTDVAVMYGAAKFASKFFENSALSTAVCLTAAAGAYLAENFAAFALIDRINGCDFDGVSYAKEAVKGPLALI
jgi:hypothetical protein